MHIPGDQKWQLDWHDGSSDRGQGTLGNRTWEGRPRGRAGGGRWERADTRAQNQTWSSGLDLSAWCEELGSDLETRQECVAGSGFLPPGGKLGQEGHWLSGWESVLSHEPPLAVISWKP